MCFKVGESQTRFTPVVQKRLFGCGVQSPTHDRSNIAEHRRQANVVCRGRSLWSTLYALSLHLHGQCGGTL
jgi:hypothetical protein